MKAYTDIEQSKKLAEILPPRSADMCYYEYTSHIDGTPKVGYKEGVTEGIPCWSLAALLDILPTIDDRNAVFCKDIRCDKWHVFYHGTATLPLIDTERHPDIIDACVDMIEKLHEYKML